jgi:hypothetical protein
MRSTGMLAAVCGAVVVLAFTSAGQAGDRQAGRTYGQQGQMEPTKSRYHRKRATRVKGFMARGGYYSYTDSDVSNVYGGSRTLFGSTNSYRDPFTDRQTTAGPFDHGFFFDSGTGPRGGDAPYLR